MTEMTPETTDGPVLLWEGQAALFASPDGGRVIRYDDQGEDRFVAIPPELVPAMEMLRANPAALVAISQSAVGGMARRMVGQLTKRAEAAAGGNGSVLAGGAAGGGAIGHGDTNIVGYGGSGHGAQ